MHKLLLPVILVLLGISLLPASGQPKENEKLHLGPLNVEPRPIAKDGSIKYDYDIIYVRAPR
ncbi:MAG TPA: hypothetical protein VK530_10085, partial [Candidatus Acidoferrum sp.]|nr:hypothetical protein [Candidatus Acidoferrum sp.]